MATAEKIAIVEEYTDKFKQANSLYLADYTGIDVETVTQLRNRFREQNVEYKVLKNRLAKRSLHNAGIENLDEYLQGVTSFIIGYDDPVVPAKIVKEFNKKKEILRLKAVYFEGQLIDAEKAKGLADLPSHEELLGKFVGMLQSPMTKLANTLQAPMQKLLGTLSALKENKQ